MQKLFLTGFLGILIGSIAFSTQPSTSQSSTPPPSTLPSPTSNRRLTITVSVAAMTDLKVKEGQTLQPGDLIADRTPEVQRLESQKSQLQLTLTRLQTASITPPAPPANPSAIAALPNPTYLEAQAQIEKTQADVDSTSTTITNKKAEIAYLSKLPNLNPLVLDHERAKLTELEQQHIAAVREYQLAMGKLGSAQDDRAHQEYQHSLNQAERTEAQNRDGLEYQRQVSDFEQRQRDRDFQISQIQLKLNETTNLIATLSAVRAPAPGKVRRIKWLGQGPDGRLNAELTFMVNASDAKSGPDQPRRTAALPNQSTSLSNPTEPSSNPEKPGTEDY